MTRDTPERTIPIRTDPTLFLFQNIHLSVFTARDQQLRFESNHHLKKRKIRKERNNEIQKILYFIGSCAFDSSWKRRNNDERYAYLGDSRNCLGI